MNYAYIINHDIANGTGFRVSLFVTGCRNKCPGCFNSELWDFSVGELFDEDTENAILRLLRDEKAEGLTLLGGEPLEPENQPAILRLLRRVKTEMPQKTVWLYTGRVVHFADGKPFIGAWFADEKDIADTPLVPDILALCDVVVDGPFLQEVKATAMFRGSANQRLIDMPASLAKGDIIMWHPATPINVTVV